jgi:hypothetical protein
MVSLLCPPPKRYICLLNLILRYVKNLLVNFNFSGAVVLEKIFKDFSNINTCIFFPNSGPTQPPSDMHGFKKSKFASCKKALT